MDLSKLKRRPSYPFETIAVAISFSPSCLPILLEAKRLSDICRAALLLLHIGEKSSEKDQQLDELLAKAKINPNQSRVIWMEGEPVDTILRLCKLNMVDLLILGALEKENILKFYIGSIARNISRRAKCSVLLLTNPAEKLLKWKKFIVNGVENPKTIHTINTALYLAKHVQVKDVTIVNEIHLPGVAMAIADESTAPEAKEFKKHITEDYTEDLQSLIEKCDAGDIKITDKIVKGKPGYAISKYASDRKADLLVINSPDTHLNLFDRIFTHDIEFILADLPCNVLIVHSRVAAD
ncbi:MAG TPA: universal stress protein [Bacteroidia bacterium]|jgi:nucleotide-binding universal stress UspA family protein